MELIALAYRWPPSEIEALDVDAFVWWAKKALSRLKQMSGG